jgi:dTDP-4-dehydrorhamnose reductase
VLRLSTKVCYACGTDQIKTEFRPHREMSTAAPQKILILGASGMLGSTLLKYFLVNLPQHNIVGTIRSSETRKLFSREIQDSLIDGVDGTSLERLVELFSAYRPNVVVNCIGLVKQLESAKNPLVVLPVNSMLPHQISSLCKLMETRFIHFSTDCVFSGRKGMYSEEDTPDADDIYGRSKLLGEVTEPHCLTIRTSIIGHELSGNRSLINWFLSREGIVDGFSKAIFSGLPTVEIARILATYVLPSPALSGLYHVSAEPIDKFTLLLLVAQAYNKKIDIRENSNFVIDRSLVSDRFRKATGFQPASWEEMIESMQNFR